MKRKHLRDKTKRVPATPFRLDENGVCVYVPVQTRKQRKRAKMRDRRIFRATENLAKVISRGIGLDDRRWFVLHVPVVDPHRKAFADFMERLHS